MVHGYDFTHVIVLIRNSVIPSARKGKRCAKCYSVIEKARCGGQCSKHSYHLAEIVDAENFGCRSTRIIELAKRVSLIHKAMCDSDSIGKLADYLAVVVDIIGTDFRGAGYCQQFDTDQVHTCGHISAASSS